MGHASSTSKLLLKHFVFYQEKTLKQIRAKSKQIDMFFHELSNQINQHPIMQIVFVKNSLSLQNLQLLFKSLKRIDNVCNIYMVLYQQGQKFKFNKSILTQIRFPQFTHLKQLNLWKNNITSIQNLTFIKFPSLLTINLANNKIRSLKPFKKLNLDNLSSIIIAQNLFSHISSFQLEHLSRSIKTNNMMFLGLQNQKLVIDLCQFIQYGIMLQTCEEIQFNDFTYVIKFKNQNLNYITYEEKKNKNKRIKQQKIVDCLKRKYLYPFKLLSR